MTARPGPQAAMIDLITWRGPSRHQHGVGLDGSIWELREGWPVGGWRFRLRRNGKVVSGYATDAEARAAAERGVARQLNNWTSGARS